MRHYRTKKDASQWLEETKIEVKSTAPFETIIINPLEMGQTIIGFGGAFTEASAYNLMRIDTSKRKKAIEAYFDPIKD